MITIRDFRALTKFPISALSTLSAATGYILITKTFEWGVVTASLGALLIAQGACALNQWQEIELDSRMERTRHRPIPSGTLKPWEALCLAMGLSLGGFLLLWFLHNLSAALLGLMALVWYNGIYTYLKRVTAFAVVPGALIGALPPVIGWVAGGGMVLEIQVLFLAFFFFMWQVPHFWILLFVHSNDYQAAGLPTLLNLFTTSQLARLTFIWMLATGASSLLLRFFGLLRSPSGTIGLLVAAAWILWIAGRVLRADGKPHSFKVAFRGLNLYALLVMGLLVLDAAYLR